LDLLHASPEVLGKGAFRMGSGVGLEESWSSSAIGDVFGLRAFCFVLIFTLLSHLYECV
jgi:hypothetical protein